MPLEQLSDNFTIPTVTIEQTLLSSYDARSAITVSGSLFENTQESLDELNEDKRIPLGLFFFKNENIVSENFPTKFNNSIFNQIPNLNLISNGDCRKIDKYYINFNDDGNTQTGNGIVKPAGSWKFLNYQGLVFKDEGDTGYVEPITTEDSDYNKRVTLSTYYIQNPQNQRDTQNQIGYGGYYPYCPIDDTSQDNYYEDINNNNGTVGLWDWWINGVTRISSRYGFSVGNTTRKAPEIAAWIETTEAFSNNRCLVFHSKTDWDSNAVNRYENYSNQSNTGIPLLNPKGVPDEDNVLQQEQIEEERYRVLNQSQTIYLSTDNFLNQYSSLKIKFKMKTPTPPPQSADELEGNNLTRDVEVGISLSSGGVFINPEGGFNSITHTNTSELSNRRKSTFGGRMIASNSVLDEWEDFEFTFNLSSLLPELNVEDGMFFDALTFFVQSGANFRGRVLLDNFEVFESYEFYPDCDVRKKISVGNYGTADLTKYYDPNIDSQKSAYKDTTAPLEAQFYFYPTYPTNEIFDVQRTPMYNDFKKGLFYIHDVDWGDGSPKEFTSEPTQIDEETMLYHTYEESGVFEVTGYMLRLKPDKQGNPIGLIHNKKFKLVINVNEGLDEDFEYFSNNGFSFIPYKKTLPIIGGYSEQSIYYKTIKRTLGFLDDGSQTNVVLKNKDTKFKLEKALLKMNSSFINDLETISPYFQSYNDMIQSSELIGTDSFSDISHFYIDNEQIFSETLYVQPGFQGMQDDPENANIRFVQQYGVGDHWQVKLQPEAAQEFEQITDTEGIPQGYLFDNGQENGIANTDYMNIRLSNTIHSFTVEVGTGQYGQQGQESTYSWTFNAVGDYPIENVYKDFDGQDYILRLKFETGGQGYFDSDDTTELFDTHNTPELKFIKYGQSIPNFEVFQEGFNYDSYGDGSAIPGFDISGLEDNQITLYLEYLKLLPFPRYIQEFDTTGFFQSPIDNVNTLDNLEYLSLSIPTWKQLGRWDIAWYLEEIQVIVNMNAPDNEPLRNINNEDIIERVYMAHDYPDQNGENTYLSHAANNTIPFENVYNFSDAVFSDVYTGMNPLDGELGSGIGDCDLTNIKYYNEPKSIWELFGFEESDLQEIGNPEERRYWENIIPKDYSIFNRQGINLNANIENGELPIDTYSGQEWLGDYYYPVLPRYGQDGEFIVNDLNNKIPFPIQSSITDENEISENLLINITSEKIDNNVIDDKSGNQNLGFNISDYKPNLQEETLKLSKKITFDRMKTSKNNGAF